MLSTAFTETAHKSETTRVRIIRINCNYYLPINYN